MYIVMKYIYSISKRGRKWFKNVLGGSGSSNLALNEVVHQFAHLLSLPVAHQRILHTLVESDQYSFEV